MVEQNLILAGVEVETTLCVISWIYDFFQVLTGPTGRINICKMNAQFNGEVFVHCLFANKLLDFISPKQVVSDAFDEVSGNHEYIDNIGFGWKYTKTLKTLFSRTEFLRSDCIPICRCQSYEKFASKNLDFGLHVCTADLNIFIDSRIRKLFKNGLNHI